MEKGEQMDLLHDQCRNDVKTMKQELETRHREKEAEQRLEITDLASDLQREEKKLLETIDALNHSND